MHRGYEKAADKQIAQRALTLYELPSGVRLRLFSLSENEVYKVIAPSGAQWALRIQRPGYQSKQSLMSELSWLLALRRDGIVATPVPVCGRDGQWVQTTTPSNALTNIVDTRNCALFMWEQGRQPDFERDLPRCLKNLGAITAQMHNHSQAWPRPDGFERFSWDFAATLGESPRWGRWRDGLGVDAARLHLFSKTVDLIRERLARYGKGPSRFGLVHGDLRPANLLLQGDQWKVIDFDDCGFSWYMYDVATVASFNEHRPEVPGFIKLFLEGYRTVRALSQADEAEISTFLMLRRLLLVAWVGSHAETNLATALGEAFTAQTVPLCIAYLKQSG